MTVQVGNKANLTGHTGRGFPTNTHRRGQAIASGGARYGVKGPQPKPGARPSQNLLTSREIPPMRHTTAAPRSLLRPSGLERATVAFAAE
jgi:hypothetical protein